MSNWTSPKTVVEGGAALASDWNTYVRDNSQYLKDEIEGLDVSVDALESSRVSSSQVEEIVVLTQAEYDGLTPSSDVLYVIVG